MRVYLGQGGDGTMIEIDSDHLIRLVRGMKADERRRLRAAILDESPDPVRRDSPNYIVEYPTGASGRLMPEPETLPLIQCNITEVHPAHRWSGGSLPDVVTSPGAWCDGVT